jgi:nucleotide-binding universal stress UspA family protein
MMPKAIFAHVPVGRDAVPVTEFAISLAQLSGAHLTGASIAFKYAIGGSPFESAAAVLVADALEADRQDAVNAAQQFAEAASAAGVLADTCVLHETLDDAGQWIAERARHHDVTIFGQPDLDKSSADELLIEAALFESGRPILLVPFIHKGPIKLDRISVCWNGSANAARAVHDAMPLLKRAKNVEVVCILEKRDTNQELQGAEIAEYLARHDLKVDVKSLVSPDLSAADTMLSHIADNDVDLLVMGGYGHSRLREFVLGGMTRDILKSMTVPVLMSH